MIFFSDAVTIITITKEFIFILFYLIEEQLPSPSLLQLTLYSSKVIINTIELHSGYD